MRVILGVIGFWEVSETLSGLVILFYHSGILLVALWPWT